MKYKVELKLTIDDEEPVVMCETVLCDTNNIAANVHKSICELGYILTRDLYYNKGE